MMRASWGAVVLFSAYAFIMGVVFERGGYVPVESELLAFGMLAILPIMGAGVIGYVLIFIVWRDRRRKKAEHNKAS